MKTLHWYLTRQVVASLMVAVAVFAFILLLGNVLKEILALLVNGQAGLGTVFKVVLLLIPYVLVFALPMGLLTATLLVFGRFSADHELTAIRSSGVSLISLITPILLLGASLCVVSAVINLFVAPHCRMAYRAILRDATIKRLGVLLQEKTFIKDIPNHIVYIGDIDATGTNLQEMLIYELNSAGQMESYTRASSGQLGVDRTNEVLNVRLFDAWRVSIAGGWRDPVYASEVELPPIPYGERRRKKVSLADMNIVELFGELRELERTVGLKPEVEGTEAGAMELDGALRVLKRQKPDVTMPVKVQIHRQISFSFACLGFTMVGIPLGIRAHRRETTFGIAAALLLVLVYYSFFIFAQAMETRPELGPHLILWMPNFVFQAVGMVLIWRANRSG